MCILWVTEEQPKHDEISESRYWSNVRNIIVNTLNALFLICFPHFVPRNLHAVFLPGLGQDERLFDLIWDRAACHKCSSGL